MTSDEEQKIQEPKDLHKITNPNKWYWDSLDISVLTMGLEWVAYEMGEKIKYLPAGEARDQAEKKMAIVEKAAQMARPLSNQQMIMAKEIERLKKAISEIK